MASDRIKDAPDVASQDKHQRYERLMRLGQTAYETESYLHARTLWTMAARLLPEREAAWVALLEAVETVEDRCFCLQQIVRINPRNHDARARLDTYDEHTRAVAADYNSLIPEPTLIRIPVPGRRTRLAALRERLSSPLYRNSLYILAATGISSAAGFLFWLLAAQLTDAASIGVVSAALAAAALLKAAADLGLGTAMIYYGASGRESFAPLVNGVIGAGWLLSLLASIGFLFGLILPTGHLDYLSGDRVFAGALIAFAVFDFVLNLQDVAMIAQKRAAFVFWRTAACNIPPMLLVIPFSFLMEGHRALFLAYTVPNLIVGLITGLIILPRQIKGYRFLGRLDMRLFARIARYGVANHGSNLLWAVPAMAMPIVALESLTPAAAGYFSINWTVTNFVLVAPRSVALSLFVETAHSPEKVGHAARRALALTAALILPAIAILWVGGPLLLGLFGRDFVDQTLLRILLLSTIPFALNGIYFAVIRAQALLAQVIGFSGFVAALSLGSAVIFGRQLPGHGIAVGWLVGQTLPVIVIGLSLLRQAISPRSHGVFPLRPLPTPGK
jgi:O-antigen/teichoic acid export membrane protein